MHTRGPRQAAPLSRQPDLRRDRGTRARRRLCGRRLGSARPVGESCEHGGFLLSLPLGNITRIGHLRTFLRSLEGNPGPRFPLLLKKVIYDGTHSGDSIATGLVPKLMKEVDIVLHSSDILAESEKEFFGNMKLLCQASIETGNPILF